MMVKEQSRLSDVILFRLNKINEGKYSRGIKSTELAEEIELTGSLIANSIKLGKLPQEDIESIENYLTTFTTLNKDKYLTYPHDNLDKASLEAMKRMNLAKTMVINNELALEDSVGYVKTFKN